MIVLDWTAVRLDIEIYADYGPDTWAQAKYLVHGFDDVLWTNDAEAALGYLANELRRFPNPRTEIPPS